MTPHTQSPQASILCIHPTSQWYGQCSCIPGCLICSEPYTPKSGTEAAQCFGCASKTARGWCPTATPPGKCLVSLLEKWGGGSQRIPWLFGTMQVGIPMAKPKPLKGEAAKWSTSLLLCLQVTVWRQRCPDTPSQYGLSYLGTAVESIELQHRTITPLGPTKAPVPWWALAHALIDFGASHSCIGANFA